MVQFGHGQPIAPAPTAEDRRTRHPRDARLARRLGFVGRVENRHVYSLAGGAQYGRGPRAADDLLIVYAEAFERDADPDDFSLAAIIAHERGHQLLARHPRIAKRISGRLSIGGEEILASILGAMIAKVEADRDALLAKATVELLGTGEPANTAIRRIMELGEMLEALL